MVAEKSKKKKNLHSNGQLAVWQKLTNVHTKQTIMELEEKGSLALEMSGDLLPMCNKSIYKRVYQYFSDGGMDKMALYM